MAQDLLDLVGNTPLVELRHFSPRPGVRILAKLEGQNPSGSIKDRVALALVRGAEADGRLKAGDAIVEASSGNTGVALAMVGKRLGYDVKVVMPRSVPESIPDLLHLYGVDTVYCDKCDDMKQALDLAHRLAAKRDWKMLGQFSDARNPAIHYATTGAEIVAQAERVDAFVAGIGTGGTLMGVGRRLREAWPDVRVVGVEPKLGEHLQGLRPMTDGYRPPLLDLDALDGRHLVGAADAISMAQRIMTLEGISAGISAGATVVAALREAEKLEQGTVVAMFADAGWKYVPAKPWAAAAAGDPQLDDTHWW